MASPNPTPGSGGSQGSNPQRQPGLGSQQRSRRDDDTKLPIGDTSGEMEDAGGGRKTTRTDGARSGGAATQNPAGSKSGAGEVEPESAESESSDIERDRSAGA